ncbi:MAG: hypothetical protein AAFN10_01075 [Bacteroidota bacterium]
MNSIILQIPLLDTLFLPDWGGTGGFIEGLLIILISFIFGYLIRRFVMLSKLRSLEDMNRALEDEVARLKARNSELEASGKNVTVLNGQINGLKTDLEACTKARGDLKLQLEACQKETASLKAQASTIDAPAAPTTQSRGLVSDAGAGITAAPIPLPKGIKKDDLKIVEGIGPKIEKLLNAEDIVTWVELSQADPARIKEILLAAGPRYRIHEPATWPQQAGLAAAGKWDELNELQDRLKGGRPA